MLAKGAGLGHLLVRIQNREHVSDAGLAVGSDRRRWTSIMTKADFRGRGGKVIWRMMTSFSTLYCDNKLVSRQPKDRISKETLKTFGICIFNHRPANCIISATAASIF